MQINGINIFIGAYAQRHQGNYQFNQSALTLNEKKAQEITTGIKEAFHSLNLQNSGVKESIQDVPNVETYGKVDITNNSGITTFFYYQEDEKYYIEQPYQGIYETDVDIDAYVNGVE